MGIAEIFFISIGLGMDAFAVSVCKGLSMLKMKWKKALIVAIYFGIFQALMPVIGFIFAKNLSNEIININYWIAFILLLIIGINMIIESLKKEEKGDDDISFKTMIVLAVATSIDALAVGVSLAFLNINIYVPTFSIGCITFILSLIGVKIGNSFGIKYKRKSEVLGGVILILIALKIILEHYEII